MKRKIFAVVALLMSLVFCFGIAACGEDTPSTTTPEEPTSLSFMGMKTDFFYGQDFSSEGLIVLLKYPSGSSKVAPAADYTVDASAYDPFTSGEQTITVSYKSTLSGTYTVTVGPNSPALTATPVALECSGGKTEYHLGMDFHTLGLKVNVRYDDGSAFPAVKGEYTVDSSDYDPDTAGTYEITVTHNEFEVTGTYSVTVDNTLFWSMDDSLKILQIANSYGDCTGTYLWNLAKGYGVKNAIVANMYIGGCSINQHWSNAQSDAPNYNLRKNSTGTWEYTDSVALSTAILSENWDFITFQSGSGDGNEVYTAAAYEHLADLTEYVRELCPDARFGYNMTWSDDESSNRPGAQHFNNNTVAHFNAIADITQEIVVPILPFIMPTGTAIENARPKLGDLSKDGYHLNDNEGSYIAGLTYLCKLIDLDPLACTYKPASVTDNQFAVAKAAAKAAIEHPYTVTALE